VPTYCITPLSTVLSHFDLSIEPQDTISAEIEQHVAIKLYNAEYAKRMAKDRTQQWCAERPCRCVML